MSQFWYLGVTYGALAHRFLLNEPVQTIFLRPQLWNTQETDNKQTAPN